jgi:DNA-binding transcriptional LysR family regulator
VSFAALRRIDLNLLVTLQALLHERSVTRAGRRVQLSQPATSASLGRLRDIFHDPLLERAGSGYRLTPLAEQLVSPLAEILSSIERTLQLGASFDPTDSTRKFQIVTTDDLFELLAAPIVARVTKQAPRLKLHFAHVDNRVLSNLETRRFDLAIQPLHVFSDYASQPLFSDTWIAIVWDGNPDIAEELTREQLVSLPHASYSLGKTGYALANRLLHDIAPNLTVQLTIENLMCLPPLLRDTPLVAIVPYRVARRMRDKRMEIRLVKLPTALPEVVIAMGWHRASSADAGHAWLRGLVADAAKTLG